MKLNTGLEHALRLLSSERTRRSAPREKNSLWTRLASFSASVYFWCY